MVRDLEQKIDNYSTRVLAKPERQNLRKYMFYCFPTRKTQESQKKSIQKPNGFLGFLCFAQCRIGKSYEHRWEIPGTSYDVLEQS